MPSPRLSLPRLRPPRRRPLRLLVSLVAVVAVTASLAASAPGGLLAGDELDGHRGHVHKVFERSARVPTERLSSIPCVDGMADVFPCHGIDLVSFIPYEEIAGSTDLARLGAELSEAWGWVDPETGVEYVLIGKTNGTAIFSLEDPTDPTYLGEIVNPSPTQLLWFDVKVYEDHAIITSESAGFGMQTFDLTQLRGVTEAQTWLPSAVYPFNGSAHNVVVNEETGYAYLVGSNGLGPALAGTTGTVGGIEPCNGGLHMVDISDPTLPVFAGCYADDAYTHDAQCIVYRGPDTDHTDREVCFAYNEDTVTIVDVTDKLAPFEISRFTYEMASYTHQGWITEDESYLVFNDELDEQNHSIPTRTLVADVRDLDEPVMVGSYEHPTESIDHNNYIKDGLAYQSNYASGLRVVDLDGIATADLEEVAWFDTFPQDDRPAFSGTWSNYPYFPSGNIVVSSGVEGVFVVRVHDEVLATYAD